MPRWREPGGDDPGLSYDPEDEDWPDDDDDGPTIPCPHCRREVFEDAERCPYCEHYLSREDAPPRGKPWWVVAGVIACLYVVYRWNVWW